MIELNCVPVSSAGCTRKASDVGLSEKAGDASYGGRK